MNKQPENWIHGMSMELKEKRKMKKLETNKVYQGSSLDVLKTFPDESIDMCITSPPYWGLRDYGTEGQIWGGDENCEHEFEVKTKKMVNAFSETGIRGKKRDSMVSSYETGFCKKCNAWKGELGLEPEPNMFVHNLCDIFDQVKRVLKPTGTCWVNLGDTYASNGTYIHSWYEKEKNKNKEHLHTKDKQKYSDRKAPRGGEYNIKAKSLVQIPNRFAIEMTNRGWILRNEIIWHKPSCLPASVKDRYTVDFEKMFFFTKNKKYYFKQQLEPLVTPIEQLKKDTRGKGWEGKAGGDKINGATNHRGDKTMGETMNPEGRNKRTVWSISPSTFKDAHFATYPPALLESPIDGGCPEDGIVLDIFMGSGTTAEVAMKQDKDWVGIDLNPEYIKISDKRLAPTIKDKKTREKASEFWS